MQPFVFRNAMPADEDALLELAGHLDTLNLPPDRGFIRELLSRSADSFSGGVDPDRFDPDRRFLFVLEGADGRVVGTSMIHAQHGTRGEPHVFFRVVEEESYAELELAETRREVHMVHKSLHLGLTYCGPTEIGGLVLDPSLRKHPHKLGRLLSLGRFLFIAAFRPWFRAQVLAELLPPLERSPIGPTKSPLWDVLGHRFTQLSYAEADRLSAHDKEFIWRLFPRSGVHVSLLPREVQDIIGEVGAQTRGALRLLQSIGFTDSSKVDPFDGGPHWEANTDEISLVRDAQWCRARAGKVEVHDERDLVPGVVARVRAPDESEDKPHFRAVWTHVHERIPEPAGSESASASAGDLGRDWAGAWAIDGESSSELPRELTVPHEDLEALELPKDADRVLVALRPQWRLTNSR